MKDCDCSVCLRSKSPIGLQVRRARHAIGWTQNRLADEAGVNASSVNTIESLNKNGSVTTLLKIAAALGIAITIGRESEWMYESYDKCWRQSIPKLSGPRKHGTHRTYLKGCRCRKCKDYNRDSMRRYRERKKARQSSD